MKRKRILPIGVLIVIIFVLFFTFTGRSSEDNANVLVPVKSGTFVVDIITTGELEAKNSVKIMGPGGLRSYGIWNVTIQNMIDEGTYVKKGQFVASLDPSDLQGKINEAEVEYDKMQSQYTQTQLDTTLQMRQARDELINLEYDVRERELVLEQSKFEPPATIQKAEIDLDKAKRALQQARDNYEIKSEQNKAKMAEVAASLRKETLNLDGMRNLLQDFTISAPEDGMLIYHKSYDGVVKAGSQIRGWDPVVATLPDMSLMLSQTYVNEVDIRKIKPGQLVEIGLDAFPDKKMNGRVIRVANVGEQRPNSDAKVFQVNIQVNGIDETIRPAMTTSNRIITQVVDSAIYIPLEGLRSQNDTITYVVKKSGLSKIKQEVMIGDANTDEVIILAGLNADDQIYLSSVPGIEEDDVLLIPEMDGKRNVEPDDPPMPEPETPRQRPPFRRG